LLFTECEGAPRPRHTVRRSSPRRSRTCAATALTRVECSRGSTLGGRVWGMVGTGGGGALPPHSLDARRVLEQRLLAQPLRLPRLGPHARRPWSHCRPADRAAPGAWNRRRAPRRERSRARRRLRRRLWAVRDAACPPSTRGGTRLVRLVRGRGGAAANLRRARGLRHGACASGRGAGGRGRRGRADFLREARQGVRRARDTRHLRARIRKVSLISSTFQNRS